MFHPLRFLHSLPLSHVFGQFMGLWCPALLGAEVHFAEQLEPSRLVELIRRERISVLVAVPRVLGMLRAHLTGRFPELSSQLSVVRCQLKSKGNYAGRKAPEVEAGQRASGSFDSGRDAASAQDDGANRKQKTENSPLRTVLSKWWRFRRVHRALGWKFWAVISGGATLPAELEGFWNGLGYALIQGYGMTETAALVTLNHPFHIAPGDDWQNAAGTRSEEIGDDGEILVREERCWPGATWQGGAMHRREGEWLATGDLAEREASGGLKFLGRKGDVIVSSAGLNIHPADLEAAMTAQKGVRGCVVVGCDFNVGPEAVAAVLFAGTDAELDAAMEAANQGLAEFQKIRHVVRWPELEFPYTSTGKVVRRKVAEWVCARISGEKGLAIGVMSNASGFLRQAQDRLFDSGRGATSAQDGGSFGVMPDALLKVVAEVTGERVAGGDGLRLAEDLNLDSLGRVQLQSAVEQRFGVELEDDAVAQVGTVGELRKMVEREVVGGQSRAAVVRETAAPSRDARPNDQARWGPREVGYRAEVEEQGQGQKQIPFENDNKRREADGSSPAGMTSEGQREEHLVSAVAVVVVGAMDTGGVGGGGDAAAGVAAGEAASSVRGV